MAQKYKPAYPAEFRQQMVELVALGKNPNHLSKEFGCHVTSIQSWCRAAGVQYEPKRPATAVLTSNSPPLSLRVNGIAQEVKTRRDGA